MNIITIRHLILLLIPLLAIGCKDKMNTRDSTFFTGEIVSIKKNGYAVDFDDGRSDVFDLAIIAMEKPERIAGGEIELVLDTEQEELFKTGKVVSFKVPSVFADDYFEGLEEGSSFNVLHASYLKEVKNQ